jgi:hypothetical protein
MHPKNGHNGDRTCPATIRASVIIATVLKAHDGRPVAADKSFVCLCHDVLNSSRLGTMPSRGIKDEVNRLIKEYAV